MLLAVFPEAEAGCFNGLLKVTQYYPTPRDILAGNSLEMVEGVRPKDRESIIELAKTTVGIRNESYRWLIKELSVQRMDALAKRDFLTATIEKEVAEHPYGDILLSFPYLGSTAAATVIGIVKDIDRWPNKKKLKKALGVYSRMTQSGVSGSTRQGKEGSRAGRRVLFQICFGCVSLHARNNDFKDHYLRQVKRGKPRMKALVSTMGKLAEILYHCLKTGELYRYHGTYAMRGVSDEKQV